MKHKRSNSATSAAGRMTFVPSSRISRRNCSEYFVVSIDDQIAPGAQGSRLRIGHIASNLQHP